MDFNKKMTELIDSVQKGSIENLKRNKVLINEIALHCRELRLYKRSVQQTNDFTKDMNAEECYKHMIMKVAEAPTMLHAKGTAIMFMPMIADKLSDLTLASRH